MSSQANKRTLSSTASEGETSASAVDTSVFEESKIGNKSTTDANDKDNKQKKKSTKSKKQKTMDQFMEINSQQVETERSPVEKKLEEIDKKLSQMLSKNDKCFIREIIKDTVNEMKDHILSSLTRRVEVLEGELHDRSVQEDKLRSELGKKDREIEALRQQNIELKEQVKRDSTEYESSKNDAEQYSRRNNIRIQGVPDDDAKETSLQTTEKVLRICNEKLNASVKMNDIDIAHRLGKWKENKNRPVIVKFVRRQQKNDLMKNTKVLKGTGIFINHDLTWTNQQVLSSLRIKEPELVESCWHIDGKIFAAFKETGSDGKVSVRTKQILYKDFDFWLSKPWPERKTLVPANSAVSPKTPTRVTSN